MTASTVHTQAELDAALADTTVHRIEIRSDAGVWLRLTAAGRPVSVVAWGNSSVVAWENSSVVARGNSSVVAWENSSVVAWENSSVVARGNSSVEAWGAAGAHAYGYSTVTASPHVAVWLHQATATVEGGVLIDLTAVDLNDTETWLTHHGVKVVEGRVHLYKAVDDQLVAGHGYRPTTYTIGAELTAADWRDDHECGHGFHVSPIPAMARSYFTRATRFLRCSMDLADVRVIDGNGASTPKVKVRALRVEAEVDLRGCELVATSAVAS